MKAKLTESDIKKLKYELRSGFVFALLFFFLAAVVSLLFILDKKYDTALYIISVSLLFAGFVYYLTNRKVIFDISNKEKLLSIKTIEKKVSKTDWEVGSGSIASFQEMKAFDLYNFFIEGVRYTVEKDLYEQCDAGDKLVFHIAPKSEHLLKIEKIAK